MTSTSQPAKRLPFKTAANTVIPWGPFKDKTIDQIAQTDDGLRYLDNLRGKMQGTSFVSFAVESYLDDPTISKDLEALIASRQRE